MKPLISNTNTITEIEKNRNESCAIEITDTGIAYARINFTGSLQPILKDCEFFPYTTGNSSSGGPNQLQNCLTNISDKYSIKGATCNWVLHPKYYRLVLTSIPKVPPDEYKEAVKWQIKDMIDYPVTDITLDIFLPPAFSKTEPAKLYAVVAQTSFLLETADIIRQNFLNLIAIDIREFAIRNLLNCVTNPEKPTGFLHIEENDCLLIIVENKQLNFIRHIPLITVAANEKSFNSIKLLDEIQRSLDYYSTELKQSAPTEFLLSPTIKPDNKIMNDISENLNLKTTPLSLDKMIKIESGKELEFELQKKCYFTIGGALRKN